MLRLLCLLAAVGSGGALLAKVYGVAEMRTVALLFAVPGAVGLGAVWIWARRSRRHELATALAIGLVAGLLGSIAYDLVRIPFLMAGYRVFAPISAFGLWLLDASFPSRWTETAGWAYHYLNGVTFAMVYALVAPVVRPGAHWLWAIAWAFALESIAVFSPFGRIFALRGNYPALGIAYFAHLAYGLPIGWMVQHWDQNREALEAMKPATCVALALLALTLLVRPLLGREEPGAPGGFRVDGSRLVPEWLRTHRGAALRLDNPGTSTVSVRVERLPTTLTVPAGQSVALPLDGPGIYQLYLETGRRTRSSFVMVEPVEQRPAW